MRHESSTGDESPVSLSLSNGIADRRIVRFPVRRKQNATPRVKMRYPAGGREFANDAARKRRG